ncbi:MAG: hypothetical protein R6V55_05725 [Desulfovermiculus sp.]
MQCPFSWRSALPWMGRTFMLLGLVFVVHKLWNARHTLDGSLQDPTLWLSVPLLGLAYAVVCSLLAFAWLALLRAQRVSSSLFTRTEAWTLYGKTQIAKYIPGNVFHFAGRQVLGKQKGMAHSTLAVALFLEILIQFLAAALLSLLAAKSILNRFELSWSEFCPWIGLSCAVLTLTVFWVLNSRLKQAWPILFLSPLAGSLVAYLAFFIFSGLLFMCTVFLASSGSVTVPLAAWPFLIGSYAFAWAVGFVIPGAPGGLGVREAVLLAMLESSMAGAGLLVGIVIFRLVTTLGDIFYFCFSLVVDS